jgi:hypothetical protein
MSTLILVTVLYIIFFLYIRSLTGEFLRNFGFGRNDDLPGIYYIISFALL